MKQAHINIGSNLGPRLALTERAAGMLEAATAGRIAGVSAPYASQPWGYDSPNGYVNIGVNLLTRLDARALLDALKEIERTIAPDGRHRDDAGGYSDRAIDLDLIALGDEVMTDADCTLPHPRMHMRDFVLIPMAEIWPEWRHPLTGYTPREMLAMLHNNKTPRPIVI